MADMPEVEIRLAVIRDLINIIPGHAARPSAEEIVRDARVLTQFIMEPTHPAKSTCA